MSETRPLTAKQSQGARSREDILDAAERLMGARGYTATSISELARASGLPTSSIYWHFGSKAGVLGAVMERGSRRFFAASRPGAQDGDLPPRARLGRLLELSTANIETHSRYLRLFVFLVLTVDREQGEPDDAIGRVRSDARRLLGQALVWAYQPWGEQVAHRIADRLGDLALALLDGIFLTAEATGDVPTALVEQAGDTLHLRAERVRDEPAT
jgi:AcrR family transcriptional regulator